ncbi:ATP-dependent Clp protease adapter ClpS [Spirochaeta lutea]|uniref:ATP-dependent Clp protease adapter protein ClpS n=1 Tax=Spirochaeta lutea TaxID=1480694 RepID=A0A098R0W3_9SPIO|nr:ATP-dependent Clp protease adapter ClpS [Spirochaeta lutea]KGE73639.1 Clp protease ClpS [Spirochaeta lutea]
MSTEHQDQHITKEKTEHRIKTPDQYRVILLNDDFTTMEFVIQVLVQIFQKNAVEATKIMLAVHEQGQGVVGIYSYDVAYSRAKKVEELAREHEYPLRCRVEKV